MVLGVAHYRAVLRHKVVPRPAVLTIAQHHHGVYLSLFIMLLEKVLVLRNRRPATGGRAHFAVHHDVITSLKALLGLAIHVSHHADAADPIILFRLTPRRLELHAHERRGQVVADTPCEAKEEQSIKRGPPAPHRRWAGKAVGTGRRQPAQDEGDAAAPKPRGTLRQDEGLASKVVGRAGDGADRKEEEGENPQGGVDAGKGQCDNGTLGVQLH
mmetsp:Transcript_7688/g.18458  ORF Transcript_7688/g.18458 Transcript_7688/m.18458 type:complete len:214 (-) Transcript_7688:395-1036(-)